MTRPRAERRFAGIVACEGLALGPAAQLRAQAPGARVAGSPAEEADALRAALAASVTGIEELMAMAGDLGAEILEFQLALLEDDDLTAPVFDAIDAGAAADAAWSAKLDEEIADYAGADDAYMAARASDLADMRDRVLAALAGENSSQDSLADGAVVLADDLAPSRFLGLEWSRLGGAALAGGSPTSHVAILARARGVPLIVGAPGLDAVADGETVLLDADAGTLVAAPGREALCAFEARRSVRARDDAVAAEAAGRPAATRDGVPVRVLINVDDPAALDALDPGICDGIGLTRSEFLFENGAPDETVQLAAYTGILAWAGGRPVTIRTLDAGGDKPIPGVTLDGEGNPFLGVRGLRLSLARPELFRVQLRALARAAACGPLKIMLPMVTVPDELEAARAALDEVMAELATEGLDHARPALGIMVETPAAALTATAFDAAFYSIGSNDLVQYTMAAARDNPAVAPLARADSPAVLELIGRTVAAGAARAAEVSLCGDMASQPGFVQSLIGLGLRTFSVAPAQIGRIKRAIGEAVTA